MLTGHKTLLKSNSIYNRRGIAPPYQDAHVVAQLANITRLVQQRMRYAHGDYHLCGRLYFDIALVQLGWFIRCRLNCLS